ncbi:hypothetical protein PhaeoP72_01191 [Phaeobacter inhibens]|uniref:hypothetical protein n=1 Tax=Phaeobacter inhibens TaxID=221822 RepID=UPI000CA30C38|nr:hypothetical protein [Phaeobacter inhibens]AUR03176.1 hypothetical protein PhaeoP72_01191 [Phaeobacter inhibens]
MSYQRMIEFARAENIAMHKSWQGIAPVEAEPKKPTRKRNLSPKERQEATKKVRRIASQFARDRRVPVKQFLGRDPLSGSTVHPLALLRRECWADLFENHGIPQVIIGEVFGDRNGGCVSRGIVLHRERAGGAA